LTLVCQCQPTATFDDDQKSVIRRSQRPERGALAQRDLCDVCTRAGVQERALNAGGA